MTKSVNQQNNSNLVCDSLYDRTFSFSSLSLQPAEDLKQDTKKEKEVSTLPSYQDLLSLIKRHLHDQRRSLYEEDFKSFIKDCSQLYPTADPTLIEKDEKRIESCIKESIEHWSYWNQIKLKMAIDRYKPKFATWLEE